MELVVTSSEMRACDQHAVRTLKIPAIVLMENAGRGTVDCIESTFGPVCGKTILIFCGKGNNGGDGFVIARHLYNRGANVEVVLLGRFSELKRESKINFESIRMIAANCLNDSMLRIHSFKSIKMLNLLPKTDLIVDAIVGTGFSGDVREPYRSVIKWINKADIKVVSVDIPSGVNADNGEVKNVAVKAHLTTTMGLKKIGLITCGGASYAGKIEVVDISIPRMIVPNKVVKTYLVGSTDVKNILPDRPLGAHKHSVGKIFVIAGSQGMTGAAAMTAASAMRSGAGAVILGVPQSIYPIVAKKLTEVMVEPLPCTSEGSVSLEAYDIIQKHICWADIIICGPGVSRNPGTREVIWKIVSECEKNILIDADGLNILSEKISVLQNRKSGEVIITPHVGELSRLIGIPAVEIEKNRVDIARCVAKQFNLTLVLKGSPTVVADEDGNVFINSTGNPGMATAGMGDVLSGVIGGLWGQGMHRTAASYAGVYLHGRAGDFAKIKYGEKSLMAMDVHNFVPQAILELEKSIAL